MRFSPRRFNRFKRRAVELSRAVNALRDEIRDREIQDRYGVRYYTREDLMTPISRLKDKLAKAAGVAQRATTAIEAEADALIAEEDTIKAKTTDAFAPHRAILAEASSELQTIKDALNLMSNGGPPLDEPPIAPLKPIVASDPIIQPSAAQLPINELPTASVSMVSTHVDDTGTVERLKLNSAQTG